MLIDLGRQEQFAQRLQVSAARNKAPIGNAAGAVRKRRACLLSGLCGGQVIETDGQTAIRVLEAQQSSQGFPDAVAPQSGERSALMFRLGQDRKSTRLNSSH